MEAVELSVHLLIASAMCGGGLLLFMKRFPLRVMLVLVVVAGVLASLPHLFVEPRVPFGRITAHSAERPASGEWQCIAEALAKEALLVDLREELSKDPRLLEALRRSPEELVDLIADTVPDRASFEEHGGDEGVRLTVFFAENAANPDLDVVFEKLTQVVGQRLKVPR